MFLSRRVFAAKKTSPRVTKRTMRLARGSPTLSQVPARGTFQSFQFSTCQMRFIRGMMMPWTNERTKSRATSPTATATMRVRILMSLKKVLNALEPRDLPPLAIFLPPGFLKFLAVGADIL